MAIPNANDSNPSHFLLGRTRTRLAELEGAGLTHESMVRHKDQLHTLDDMHLAVEDMRKAGISLEHHVYPVRSLLILPLFALFVIAGAKLGVLIASVSAGALGYVILHKSLPTATE